MIDIYSNPVLYDAIHETINSDKELIQHYARKTKGSVLELAAGTGRLTEYILDLNLEYTGIDNSKVFIETAKKRFNGTAKFFVKDMRDFNFKKRFNFIFIGFNSFLHNLQNKDASSCLKSVHNHLSNNGLFFISLFVPNPDFLYQGSAGRPATDYFVYKNKKCRIIEKNKFNEDSQINSLKWYLEEDGIINSPGYAFYQKMYYPHMMDILLDESGFTIERKIGDWDNSVMHEDSVMQIYICKKV